MQVDQVQPAQLTDAQPAIGQPGHHQPLPGAVRHGQQPLLAPSGSIYDTPPSPALRKAAHAAGRDYRPASRFQARTDRATLAVVVWPITDQRLDPVVMLGGLRRRLRPGGFLAVILTTLEPDTDAQAPG